MTIYNKKLLDDIFLKNSIINLDTIALFKLTKNTRGGNAFEKMFHD